MTNLRLHRTQSRMDPLSLGLMIAFVVLALATAVVAFLFVRNLVQSWTMTDLPGAPTGDRGEIVIDSQGVPMLEPLQPAGGPLPDPWDGKSRVTLLLLGLDLRDWEEDNTAASRSDSMILLTMDPISSTAGILNIPRDLWVTIPGYGHGKINTAYFLGEANKLPGGGPGLAVETVEQFIGVPINYYAQIDFHTFERFIDEINGVKITIKEEIRLDPIGPNNDVTLQPGRYVLNGDLALAYARNRYTDGGDFDRARRQQEVILAIRDRILEGDGYLTEMISKAPQLYNILKDGIRTNMNLTEAVKLAVFAQRISVDEIQRAVITPDTLIESTAPDGQSIYIPIPDEIRLIRDQVFTTGGPVGPMAVSEDPKTLMQNEQARVRILNGTSVTGLASRTSEYLRSQGMNVTEEGTADQVYEQSMLYIYSGKPYSAAYVAQLMSIGTGRVYNQFNPDSPIDIAIIVGNDWAYNNPMP